MSLRFLGLRAAPLPAGQALRGVGAALCLQEFERRPQARGRAARQFRVHAPKLLADREAWEQV